MKTLERAWLLIGALVLGVSACADKDPGKAHREAGDSHMSDKEWAAAADEYDKSLQLDPKQEKTWEKKAFSLMQAGELDKAAETLLKTLDFKTDPAKKAELYRNIAGIFMQKQLGDKAEPYFVEAVKIEPTDVSSLGWLGEIHAQKGGAKDMKAPAVPAELEKAFEWYDKLIAAKPDDMAGYFNKRIALMKYVEYERLQKEAAEQEIKTLTAEPDKKDKEKDKDKLEAKQKEIAAKVEAARADAQKHEAHMKELVAKLEAHNKVMAEASKNVKPAK